MRGETLRDVIRSRASDAPVQPASARFRSSRRSAPHRLRRVVPVQPPLDTGALQGDRLRPGRARARRARRAGQACRQRPASARPRLRPGCRSGPPRNSGCRYPKSVPTGAGQRCSHRQLRELRCSRNASGGWRASFGSRIGNHAQLGTALSNSAAPICQTTASAGPVRLWPRLRFPRPGRSGTGRQARSRREIKVSGSRSLSANHCSNSPTVRTTVLVLSDIEIVRMQGPACTDDDSGRSRTTAEASSSCAALAKSALRWTARGYPI
jgi:hypothetical protein